MKRTRVSRSSKIRSAIKRTDRRRRTLMFIASSVAALFAGNFTFSSIASAQSGNWNVDSAGTWSTATNWTPAVVPGNAAGDVIGLSNNIAAARTVTIDTTPRTAGILNIGDSNSTHAFTLAASGGGSLTLNNGGLGAQINKTGTIADGISAAVTIADNLSINLASGLTLSGVIAVTGGPRTVTKTGTGALVISPAVAPTAGLGGGSTFNINAGQLTIANNANMQSATGALGGATGFAVNLGDTSGTAATTISLGNSINFANAITVRAGSSGAKTLTGGAGVNPNFSGIITANDNLLVAWGGTGGSFTVGGASSAGSTVATGSTVTFRHTGTAAALSDNSAWAGAGALAYESTSASGSPSIAVAGAKTYTGGATIRNMGAVNTVVVNTSSLGAANAPTSGAFGTGTLTLNNGARLRSGVVADATVFNSISFGGNVSFGTVAAEKNLILAGDASLGGDRILTSTVGTTVSGTTVDFSGNISGAGFGITKAGAGNLRLSGANTYTGTTFVNGGTLDVTNGAAIADTGLVSLANVAATTFRLNNNETIGNLAGGGATGGNVDLQANTLTLGAASDASFGGIISGTGGLTKQGASVSGLTNANTYTGATLISDGTLALSAAGNVNASSGITINGSGAKLLQTSSAAVTPTVTLTQGTLTGSTTINTVTVGAGTGGIITNNNGVAGASLTIGSLTLDGAANLNLFSGTTASTLNVTGTLTTAPTAATLTANNLGGWANGSTYTILTFGGGAIAGSGDNFTKVANNLSARQTGTFNTSVTGITLAIAGDNARWIGLDNGNWQTGTTGTNENWRLVTATTATTFLTSDDALFDDNATGTTTLNINAANVSPNTTVFNNSSLNYVLGSSGGFGIASGTLTKNGTGSLTINNANSYTAGTTLNAGTLILGNANAIGTGEVTIAGGSLDSSVANLVNSGNNTQAWNSDFSFVGTQNLNLGTGAVTMSANRNVTVNANTLTVGGAIGGGAVSLTKSGGGTLTLTGVNTYTGGTNANGGILQLGDGGIAGSLSLSSAISVGTGGVFAVNQSDTVTQGTDFNGAGITGAGGFNQAGSGTTIFNAANAYTGVTAINAGTLQLGAAGTTGALTGTTGITSSGTATLAINRSNAFTQAVDLNGQAITGAGLSVLKSAANTATLSVANSYGGGTSITGGVLSVITNGGALGSGTVTLSGSAVRLTVEGALSLANDIVVGTGGTFAGAAGRGLVESSGTGTATITGNITVNGAVTAGGHFASSAGNDLVLNGVITAPGGFSSRTGTVTYGGGGTGYTVFNATGTARVGATNGIATTATINFGTLGGAGTLDLNGFNQSLAGIVRPTTQAATIGNSSTTSDSTLTITGTSSFSGIIQNVVGTVGTRTVALTVDGGDLTLTGANTYTGATTVGSGGLLVAGSAQAFGVNSATAVSGTLRLAGNSNSIGSLAGTATGIVENASATAATLTTGGNNTSTVFGGLIQDGTGGGALSLVKTGTGTQTISGSNTFSGATIINGGILLANSSGALGTGGVTVNAGTLGGTGGVIAGGVTLAGGSIAPGSSIGTLGVGSVNGAGSLGIEYDSSNGTIDLLNVAGELNISSIALNFSDLNGAPVPLTQPFYVFANYTTRVGNFTSISGLPANYDVDYLFNSGTSIAIVAVPEPGTLALLTVAIVGGGLYRRSRKQKKNTAKA